jgi:hypothetical protein
MGFESFILDQLAKGFRLDFGLVSFYPRLSGGLSSRDADPEADRALRGDCRDRGELMERVHETRRRRHHREAVTSRPIL